MKQKVEKDSLYYMYLMNIDPFLDAKNVEYEQLTEYDILFYLPDGNKILYDDFSFHYRYFNKLNFLKPYLTKKEWEREFRIRLKQLMLRKSLNQEQLSKKIEISQAMLSKYLNGSAIPSAYILNKIIDALDCTANDLLFVPLLIKRIYKEENNV